jgi:YHS domain-containing protein
MVMLLMTLAGGCANSSSGPTTRMAANQPHAECLVCKHNADLACVDVSVDSQTPRTVYDGKTYYFCSRECECAFEKNPRKYLSP